MTRPLARALAFAAASGAALAGVVAIASCAGDEPAQGGPVDASRDAPLIGDAQGPPDADAQTFGGDPCGDTRGLEEGSPWPLRGGCPKRAGLGPTAGPQNAVVKWSVAIPAGASSPAVAASRALWFGTSAGDVAVVSPGGVVQGALHTGGAVRSSPAIAKTGVTVIGSSDGTLYGVTRIAPPSDAGADASDAGDAGDAGDDAGSTYPPARKVFALPLGAAITSSPAIGADGTIYVGTSAGELVAVAADGSAVKWRATTNDTNGSSPALAADGTIYVGSSDHRLYAIGADGATRWTYDAGAEMTGSPVVGADGSVYAGAGGGRLLAITADGSLRWSYATAGAITGPPAVTDSFAYVGSTDKKLHAVALGSGTAAWTYTTLGAVAPPVVGRDGTIYVGSEDGHVYAITSAGLLFFAVNAKGPVTSQPALSDDGTLYVTTGSGLLAIGP